MADNATPSKPPVAVLDYEPTAFEQTLIKHKNKLILVAVLAIAGVVGWFGVKFFTEQAQRSAGLDFTRAQTADDFLKVAAAHRGQPAGGSALLQAADLLSASKPGEAVADLKKFLAEYGQHPLVPLAEWRIAEYLSKAGDKAAAEAQYEKVSKSGSIYASLALVRLGDLRWAEGRIDEAKKLFQSVKPAFTADPVSAKATQRVESALTAKKPLLIEPEHPVRTIEIDSIVPRIGQPPSPPAAVPATTTSPPFEVPPPGELNVPGLNFDGPPDGLPPSLDLNGTPGEPPVKLETDLPPAPGTEPEKKP